MDTQFYESLLKNRSIGRPDSSVSWDTQAKEFREMQKNNKRDYSWRVVEFLTGKGLLKDFDVLDIGGGTGRYAIPFAAHANEVTIADISAQMLEYAKEDAESAGRKNLQYVRLNWEEADLKKLDWEKRFNLVFASMCAGIMSKAGLSKMSAASREWCQINQLIEMTDSISEKLKRDLEIESKYDPHNDRDAVQGVFNLLWVDGFNPEVTYLKDISEQVLSVDEAFSRYSSMFGEVADNKGVDLKNLLEGYASGGNITIESRVTIAVILWKV